MPADDAASLAGAVLASKRLASRFATTIAQESNGVLGFLVELARATGAGARVADPRRGSQLLPSKAVSRGDLSDPARSISSLSPLTLEELIDERIRELPAPTARSSRCARSPPAHWRSSSPLPHHPATIPPRR